MEKIIPKVNTRDAKSYIQGGIIEGMPYTEKDKILHGMKTAIDKITKKQVFKSLAELDKLNNRLRK